MIKYNVTGSQRKRLVQKLAALTRQKAEYMGLPSMAFKVGDYIVGKTGTIEGDVPDDIIKALARAGFTGEVVKDTKEIPSEITGFTFNIPMDDMTENAVDNFVTMLKIKGPFIKKAFKLSSLPVDYGEDAIKIRWFEDRKIPEETASNIKIFVSAMINLAKQQKYVIDRTMKTDNPRYNFRAFLYTIGLSGSEYKGLRKEFLKNLKGSTNTRHPVKKGRVTKLPV